MTVPEDDDRVEIIGPTETSSSFGHYPERRPIELLLDTGLIVIDKPSGPTSHQVVSWIKKILDIEKAGHHGTLDPNTTGVLPVALGNAVRMLDLTLHEGKEYAAIKFFLYTLFGSVFMLLVMIALFFAVGSFDMLEMMNP
ncbi:MAG: hypothetical protein U9R75_03930, partial [Candidatus Thermoplasmatota archaeon]|nr:hypothetical protein [Candidatus Thermoplasmatota archaeon]